MVDRGPRLSRAASSALGQYREHERPDAEIARRSWRELRQRMHHPEAQAREAWALSLPPAPSTYDDEDDWDGIVAPVVPPATGFIYWTRAVATSVAIAATVLLSVRVVATSATTLTEGARGEALEAPYQGGADRGGGQAVERQAQPAATAKRRRARAPTTAGVAAPMVDELDELESAAPVAVQVDPSRVRAAVAATHRKVKPTRANAPTQVDDLATELQLVRMATEAKRAGDNGRARTLLNEHRRQFPRGALAQERQVLRAEVLCAQGKKSDARALAGRFAAAHPTHALLGRMNRACAD